MWGAQAGNAGSVRWPATQGNGEKKLQERPSAYAEHVSRGGTPVRSPAKTDDMKNEPKRTIWEMVTGDHPNATTLTSTPTPSITSEDVCDDPPSPPHGHLPQRSNCRD